MTESSLQIAVMRYLRLHRYMAIHIPNGGWRSKATAGRMKAEGVRAGAPDILVFDAPKGYLGWAIELKTAKGRLTAHQQVFHADLRDRGWRVDVCRSVQDVADLVNELYTDR